MNDVLTRTTGVNPNIARQLRGTYVEAAYRVLPTGFPHDAAVFLRYENFDTQFRMPEGYIGPIPDPYRRTRMSKGLGVEDAHPFEPSSTELSMWLQKNDVTAVVIGDLARKKFERVVYDAGFRPVYEGDGVSVWRMASPSTAGGTG